MSTAAALAPFFVTITRRGEAAPTVTRAPFDTIGAARAYAMRWTSKRSTHGEITTARIADSAGEPRGTYGAGRDDEPATDTEPVPCAECGHLHYLGAGHYAACPVCPCEGQAPAATTTAARTILLGVSHTGMIHLAGRVRHQFDRTAGLMLVQRCGMSRRQRSYLGTTSATVVTCSRCLAALRKAEAESPGDELSPLRLAAMGQAVEAVTESTTATVFDRKAAEDARHTPWPRHALGAHGISELNAGDYLAAAAHAGLDHATAAAYLERAAKRHRDSVKRSERDQARHYPEGYSGRLRVMVRMMRRDNLRLASELDAIAEEIREAGGLGRYPRTAGSATFLPLYAAGRRWLPIAGGGPELDGPFPAADLGKPSRVAAEGIEVGDYVRQGTGEWAKFYRVASIEPNPTARWLHLHGGGRIRPRHTTLLPVLRAWQVEARLGEADDLEPVGDRTDAEVYRNDDARIERDHEGHPMTDAEWSGPESMPLAELAAELRAVRRLVELVREVPGAIEQAAGRLVLIEAARLHRELLRAMPPVSTEVRP